MVEWDRVGLYNDYGLVTGILHVLYIIIKSGITWKKVRGCRFGYELVMTMGLMW